MHCQAPDNASFLLSHKGRTSGQPFLFCIMLSLFIVSHAALGPVAAVEVASPDDALAYGGRRLAGLHPRQLDKGHGLHLALNVDAVEQRAGYLAHVLLYAAGGAGAVVRRVAVVSTRAGVHRGHEHERGGVRDGILCARHVDDSVLKGLAQDLEDGARKFG